MNIFVNARFLTQPISGVQRYGIECSLQIKRKYPSTVFLSPHNIIHHDIASKLDAVIIGHHKGHLWEQISLPYFLKSQQCPPLLSLANTAPLTYTNNYITLHDLAFMQHPEWNSAFFAKWYNYLIPAISKRAKHIFTVSETIKNEIEQVLQVSSPSISVTGNGVPSDWILNPPKPVQKEKMILSVGTFNPRKNQSQLVRAFVGSSLEKEYELVLIGDKNHIFKDPGVEAMVTGHHKIKMLQNVNNNELRTYYQRASLVVSTSQYEGFGIPLLEGLFFGCNILCTDIPVYRELFGNYASFCPVNDIHETRIQLENLANSPFPKTNGAAIFDRYNYGKASDIILQVLSKPMIK